MARYTVKEDEGFEGGSGEIVRVFQVEKSGDRFRVPNVWLSGGRLACTACQSPLRGMSGSCAHVAAARRFLAKAAPADEAGRAGEGEPSDE